MSDPTKVSRRLVAVFAADVEGYSRLMGADEAGTLKGLTERRAILDRLIGEHRGRIAKTAIVSTIRSIGPALRTTKQPRRDAAPASRSLATVLWRGALARGLLHRAPPSTRAQNLASPIHVR